MDVVGLKHIVKPFVPIGVLDLFAQYQYARERRNEDMRRARFEGLRDVVPRTLAAIRALSAEQCRDRAYLESVFIPSLGLNDELLHEMPTEFSAHYGKGLHIWQYPSQLAGYLSWIADNALGITSYLEIGCRWGGMTILVTEWLRKNGAAIQSVSAIDPIRPTPFIEEYFKILSTEGVASSYLQAFSTSSDAHAVVDRLRPDFVFIDGDHRLKGALEDHLLIRPHANVIVHHDIHSQACPDTTLLWKALQDMEADRFEATQFIEQYPSVGGDFLGIGVLKRRSTAA